MIKKVLFLILGTIALLIVLLEAISLINRSGLVFPFLTSKPTPEPIVVPLPTIGEEFLASPSAYATDEAVLKIERDLMSLEKDLETVDLDELPLKPPSLDLNVVY